MKFSKKRTTQIKKKWCKPERPVGLVSYQGHRVTRMEMISDRINHVRIFLKQTKVWETIEATKLKKVALWHDGYFYPVKHICRNATGDDYIITFDDGDQIALSDSAIKSIYDEMQFNPMTNDFRHKEWYMNYYGIKRGIKKWKEVFGKTPSDYVE